MQPLTRASLAGVWGTVLLPLRSDDTIDWRALHAQVDRLVTSGLDGVYAHGTAGEFQTLDDNEFDRINEVLAAACDSAEVPFQIGANHPSAQACLRRVRRARELAPGAVQVIVPDWVELTEDEVMAFVCRVAEVADPVPVVLYNPPHAKTQVTARMLGRLLAEIPTLIGAKMAGGDKGWYREMRQHAPECSLFTPGNSMASGLAQGARGSYSNVACLSPAGAARWYRLARTDPHGGLELERRVGEFFRRHVRPLKLQGFADPALDKFLCAVGGWAEVGTRTRWPLKGVPGHVIRPARRDARALVPELLPT